MIRKTLLLAAAIATVAPHASHAEGPSASVTDGGGAPIAAPGSPLGFRYGRLSSRETRALRRDFKLPMDALSSARTVEDLAKRAVVAPLPPTNQPFLAVNRSAAGDRRNPFSGSMATSFRDDPMRALGEMLGASGSGGAEQPAAGGEFAEADSGLNVFDATPTDTASATDAEVAAEEADPFADDADPFGSEEDDPFAF